MENHKSIIKIITSYILGLFILFTIFSIYLYFFAKNFDFEYYLKPLLEGNIIEWLHHFDARVYIWGLLFPGLLEMFFIRNIQRFKIILILILSIFIPFLLVLLSQGGGGDMGGLAFLLIIELVLPINIIFSLLYLIFYNYKFSH